jgi:hypothetical protein
MPLKTASGVGRGRALAAVGKGSRGAAGPACSGTDLAADAPSMPAFASAFLSGFLAGFEAFGLAESAFEPEALALVPLALPAALLLALLAAGLAALALLPELARPPELALVPVLALPAEPVVRVPAEELFDGALLAVLALLVLALLVLALLVLALLVLALPVAGLAPLALRVLVALVPELPLARDPGLSLLPAVLAGVRAVVRADVDRAPWARVLRLAGVVLAADVVAAVAVDIALAASVSDLTADSIALVAVLIDCRAVVIVLADVVALVAAEFSFVAAFVTLVAAEDTARGVGADLAVPRLVAVRPPLLVRPLVLLLVRLLVARPVVARLADDLVPVVDLPVAVFLALDLAELGFAALALAVADLVVERFAVSVGTDPSPRS